MAEPARFSRKHEHFYHFRLLSPCHTRHLSCRTSKLMYRSKSHAIITIMFVFFCCDASAFAQDVGPVKGSLVIVGGGGMSTAISDHFIQLAGGKDARIAIVPTASSSIDDDDIREALNGWKDRGAANVFVLHTRDRDEADSDVFVKQIDEAAGIWFGGGRQWRIADAYLGTKSEQAFRRVLQRDGVIGGSSAGATIQGSYLARGDTSGPDIMMGDHTVGLGLLKNTAIDQHLLKRNRQFDLLEVIKAHPKLLGIGIDEATAVIVKGDTFDVVGESYVAIYDSKNIDQPEPFYLLSPGQRFDLKNRHIVPRRRRRR